LNGPVVDLNLLRANSLYGDGTSNSRVQELILENERRRSWIIFYTHDVRSTPSRYGCTPDLLEFAVSFAARRGARILTVADVVAELVSQPREKEYCPIAPKKDEQLRQEQSESASSPIGSATLRHGA
jgi:hypothetical protein